jgi:hypothetical protein
MSMKWRLNNGDVFSLFFLLLKIFFNLIFPFSRIFFLHLHLVLQFLHRNPSTLKNKIEYILSIK